MNPSFILDYVLQEIFIYCLAEHNLHHLRGLFLKTYHISSSVGHSFHRFLVFYYL